MSIMLRVLTMLLVGYGCGHHHHPLSRTLFWVSVWKAVLSPKACSENLNGIATMLVVLVLSHTFLRTCLESNPDTKAP